jgi:GTP cyclohydrolase I
VRTRNIRKFLSEDLGLDLTDPNLKDTPNRIYKMFSEELLCNSDCEFPGFTTFPNTKKYDQIVGLELIEFVSVCSHHFIPFYGTAWFYYIPRYELVGASKPARCILHYAKRPQLQETLCHDVLNKFMELVRPIGAMIYLSGKHGCMSHRGVKQPNMQMSTSAVAGAFRTEKEMESKALQMIQISLLHNK